MAFSPTELYNRESDKFTKYLNLIVKWNKKFNLTALTKEDEIIERHFIDSLQILPLLVSRETILDVGPGAGFPGIPIKIVQEGLRITLIDSNKKRADFMKTVIRDLGLKGITVSQTTLEEGMRVGIFDAIVSRGTFKMDQLLRIAKSNLRPGGAVIALKGTDVDDEVVRCKEMVKSGLFLSIKEIPYILPYSRVSRKILYTELQSQASPTPSSSVSS